MKSLVAGLFLITGLTLAQNNSVDANQTGDTFRMQRLATSTAGTGSTLTGGFSFYNPKFDREGSVYLFDGWNNSARIYAKNNGGVFSSDNINFNIQRSMFENKKGDSISSYNFASIEKIQVGGKTFKSYYYEPLKRQRVFEVIYQGEDFTILKGYSIDILEASPNPMLARTRDKIIQRHEYYMDTEESIQEFKFNKKNIVKALGPVKGEIAKEYAKKYDKSFGNEEDIKMILNYVQHQ